MVVIALTFPLGGTKMNTTRVLVIYKRHFMFFLRKQTVACILTSTRERDFKSSSIATETPSCNIYNRIALKKVVKVFVKKIS